MHFIKKRINYQKAFGYEVIFQKGDEQLALHDEIRGEKHHLSIVAHVA